MTDEPILSVLFATRDGAGVIGRTLDAIAASIPPPMPWHLVVVDNGSRDRTRAILESFRGRLPLSVVSHPTGGKNAALNAGIEMCRGQLIVICDDDILPDPDFLCAWGRLVNARPQYGLFGGRIEPYFETAPPAWLLRDRRHHALMFSERDLPEGKVEPGDIYGCNMAVRRRIFDCGHRFDERIGPDANDPNYRMGSEVEFLRRVGRAGEMAWFARDPRVKHIVRSYQWTEAAWMTRGYRCGRGRAYLMLKEGRTMRPPKLRLWERIALLLPGDRYRLPALSALHLARGFADECLAAGRTDVLAS